MVFVTGQAFSAGKRLHHTAGMLRSPCCRPAFLWAEQYTEPEQKGAPP